MPMQGRQQAAIQAAREMIGIQGTAANGITGGLYGQQVWCNWTNASTTTATFNSNGWYGLLNGSTSTANTFYATQVWQLWQHVQAVSNMPLAWGQVVRPQPVVKEPVYDHPITREQHAAWRGRAIRAMARSLADDLQKRRVEQAKSKAVILLRRHLTDEQRRQYDKEGFFLVEVNSGRKYRIEKGVVANVKLLGPEGERAASLCVHPADSTIPDADVALAQKLMLLCDEETFIRLANVHHASPEANRIIQEIKRKQPAPLRRAA